MKETEIIIETLWLLKKVNAAGSANNTNERKVCT
jgi:hypothetical protein